MNQFLYINYLQGANLKGEMKGKTSFGLLTKS